jgi:GxxExxY protein
MNLIHESITDQIIAAGIEVHRETGPGLLESTYEACLSHELFLRGIQHKRQVVVPIVYKGEQLEEDYRIDVLVDERVVIEIKSVQKLEQIHEAQLLTYLRLSGNQVGLLLNFNTVRLKDGLKRLVL